MNTNQLVTQLVNYGIRKNMISKRDEVYVRNRLMSVLEISDYAYEEPDKEISYDELMDSILAYAYEQGIIKNNTITQRDILDSKVMDCLMEPPSMVESKFYNFYMEKPTIATNWFYQLNKNSNYIRSKRIAKNMKWKVSSKYGPIDITINLSKPEKDPEEIEAAKNVADTNYPKCFLCKENEGYYGRIDHPGRSNHRIISMDLNDENWFFQYSPYSYYNEHCIVFKDVHDPMKISEETFNRLLDFVQKMPHYFIGSNADLPIVGGSILSHDHFQGGRYSFGIEAAEVIKEYTYKKDRALEAELLNWPLSTIRLKSPDKYLLQKVAWEVTQQWINYSDEKLSIINKTKDVRHNTVTPIARVKNGAYELDLVLRNNRRNEKYPLGIFHPHSDVHHIKKENIGLIEVMGLAVLPARLKQEMHLMTEYLLTGELLPEALIVHKEWLEKLKEKYELSSEEATYEVLKEEIGNVFVKVLEYAGVYKMTPEGIDGFKQFIDSTMLFQ